jgi:HEAT repeat protein
MMDAPDRPTVLDAVQRRLEAAEAGHRGDLPTARRLSTDSDPSVRATALAALARAGALDQQTLVGATSDPSPLVRRRACQLASTHRQGEPDVQDPDLQDLDEDPLVARLVALLGDEDHSVAEMAAWSLGERVGPDRAPRPESPGGEALGSLVETLAVTAVSHPAALCREAAVAALGAIGHADGLPAILAAAHDRPAVRRRAVIALASYEGPEVDAALQAALTDRDWQVRQAAEDLLEVSPVDPNDVDPNDLGPNEVD